MYNENNLVQSKSYKFAIRIVNVHKYLTNDKREYVLSKQVLRSGTSIGANVEEAIGGQSSKDFFAKLSIAYKEARETRYWINLLRDTGYLEKYMADSLLNDCEEVCRIIGKIQSTIRRKTNNVIDNCKLNIDN